MIKIDFNFKFFKKSAIFIYKFVIVFLKPRCEKYYSVEKFFLKR